MAASGAASGAVWRVDLNADVGEDPEPPPGAAPDPAGGSGGTDRELLRLVTTAHVACGFHAGGPWVMRRTLVAAASAGVSVGAHPSYPDAGSFGRAAMDHPPDRVADDLLYQVGALQAVARAHGVAVRSVKPHGALYHRMAAEPEYARAVAAAVRSLGDGIRLVVPAGSAAGRVAEEAGVRVVHEAFCDRAYRPDGELADRGHRGALVTDPAEAARRAVSLATVGEVAATDGSVLRLRCDTLCVHGDTPGAVTIAAAVRGGLARAGVRVASFAGPEDAPAPRAAPGGRGRRPG